MSRDFYAFFVCLINLIWFKGKDKFAYGETCNSVWRDWKSCFTYPLTFPLCCECARLIYFTFLDIFCLRGRFPTLPWDFLHYYTCSASGSLWDCAGFEPGTPNAPKVWCTKNGPQNLKNDLLSVHEKEELLAGLEPQPLLEDGAQLHHVHLRGHQPLHLHRHTHIRLGRFCTFFEV